MRATKILWLSVVIVGCGSPTLGDVPPPQELVERLQGVVNGLTAYFNFSLSVGIVGGSPNASWEYTYAAGVNDRITGTNLTVDMHIPVGSVTKAWTAVRTMQLVEKGVIDLDTPACKYIDPWLAKQTPPVEPLGTMFVDKRIEQVTVRQLLSMSSGLSDYDDKVLQDWTESHPNEDYLPIQYIKNVSQKPLLFAPNDGSTNAAYSSDGFVLLGFVLAATTGAATWEDLDQMVLPNTTSGGGPAYPDTFFARTGPCSSYPNVAHQYTLSPPKTISTLGSPLLYHKTSVGSKNSTLNQDSTSISGPACGDPSKIFPNTSWAGRLIGGKAGVTQDECCGLANKPPYFYYPDIGWTWTAGINLCEIYYYGGANPATKPSAVASSGQVQSPDVQNDWFLDMKNDSCLNGWTMGNLATTSLDMARFFSKFVRHETVSDETLLLMKPNHVFTTGFASCSGDPDLCLKYGLGTIEAPTIVGTPYPCIEPRCRCDQTTKSCGLIINSYGHPGQDWGSGMPVAGFFPDLGNISIAIGATSEIGMNTTLSLQTNAGASSAVQCYVLQAAAAVLGGTPTLPPIVCA